MLIDLATLIVKETAQAILDKSLIIAEAVGLPVSSWAPGDPSRVYLKSEAEQLATLEDMATEFIKSGFLDTAEGEDLAWLKLHVDQVYGVTPVEATYAGDGGSDQLTLTNTGGGSYPIDIGALTVRNANTDKTYHNTTAGTLTPGPGTTLTLSIVADEAGSDSNAAVGEITELVTDLLGVTCTNTVALAGTDAEEAIPMRERARASLGALSPDGPRDAYRYVATTPELAGTSVVTRVRTQADNGTGEVLVWLASAAGAVDPADVALVEAALIEWAAPLCVTPVVASATPITFNITYTLWLYAAVSKTEDEIKEAIALELAALFAARPIGGDIVTGSTGRLYVSMVAAAIRNVHSEHSFRVVVATPAGDTDLAISEVPVLGTVTGTINLVSNPI